MLFGSDYRAMYVSNLNSHGSMLVLVHVCICIIIYY